MKVLRNTQVVLGLGNLLLRDDGLGVWLVRALSERRLPPGTLVREVGTEIFSVPFLVSEHSQVLLVDAVMGNRRPGAVYRLDPGQLAQLSGRTCTAFALHDFRLESLIFMLQAQVPSLRIRLFGVQPARIDFGYGLTPGLQRRLPLLVGALLREIRTMT